MDGIGDRFAPLGSCIAPSDGIRASPQEEASRYIPTSPVSEVCDVFSNWDLPSSSERQPRKIAVVYIIMGVSWNPMTNNLKGNIPCLFFSS